MAFEHGGQLQVDLLPVPDLVDVELAVVPERAPAAPWSQRVKLSNSSSVGYDYDNVGNRTSITYPGGSNDVTYAYDEAHNLSTVTDWNDAETTYSYTSSAPLT